MSEHGSGPGSGAARRFQGFAGVTEIGVGRYSTVYAAHETNGGREVALKVVVAAGTTEAGRRAFRREVKVIGGLGAHPNLVSLVGMFKTEQGDTVLVLE